MSCRHRTVSIAPLPSPSPFIQSVAAFSAGLLSPLGVEVLPLSLLSGVVSLFDSLFDSLFASPPPLRLSVMYQPEPLKTIPAG